eukprot:scaffold7344_cov145-Cylindrotheca_fusiformis.AAC.24
MFMFLVALGTAFFFRIAFVLLSIRRKWDRPGRANPMKTLVVLGSGGHTTEMLHLLKNLDAKKYAPLSYIIARTDTTSLRRVEAFGGRQPDTIYFIPRSREVGQSYASSIGTTLWSFIHAIGITFRIRPSLLLCNGPGTCLPIAIATLLCRIFGFCEGKIVFVESFCRVKSLSLTGKILYHIVDLFVVHWDSLLETYPRSEIVATFVPQASATKEIG